MTKGVAHPSTPPAPADERQQLLDAARAVLARRAWSDVKIESILRQARLSRRAFYRHFDSKDHLLLGLLDQETEHASRRLHAAVEGDVLATPNERVTAWIDAVLRLVSVEDSARRTSLFASLWSGLEREFPTELSTYRDRLLEPLVNAIEAGRTSGQFPAADPPGDARAVYYMVSGLVRDRAVHPQAQSSDSPIVRRFALAALQSHLAQDK
jgi:AcrR family transcriptional regulator